MNKHSGQIIDGIVPGSIAEELGVLPGMRLCSINGERVRDVFDYRFLMANAELNVVLSDADGQEWLLEIEKEETEDLGFIFQEGLMDTMRGCSNRCIFCFIDQLPRGMRKTLYFKDDDARLSFLQGNYITLTNLTDADIQRIIRYRMEPINISVHTTNPQLRNEMLGNQKAGASLQYMQKLFDAGIEMNAQIVLCRGVNDGEELSHTIAALAKWRPCLRSVSVVPVGLTKYREKLYPLQGYDAASAASVIDEIERWQARLCQDGVDPLYPHFVHASDEWYLLCGRALPEEARYDAYPQIENGVGMVRSFLTEIEHALSEPPAADALLRRVSLVSGTLIAPVMRQVLDKICAHYPGLSVDYLPIENDFFGRSITVSGLVTGRDLIAQMQARRASMPAATLPQELLFPETMLRSGTDVFLDDVTIRDVEEALAVKAHAVSVMAGESFLYALLGLPAPMTQTHNPYEPWESGFDEEKQNR